MKGRTRTFVIVLTMATMIGTVAMGAAHAGKGGQGKGHPNSTTATGSFDRVMVYDANGNGLPNYGDGVTFAVTSSVSEPWVQLTCYQNGDWVTNQFVGFYDGYPSSSQIFPLRSWKWPGGAADCNARLFDGSNNTTLATLSFPVDA